jgi:hypothetical protein
MEISNNNRITFRVWTVIILIQIDNTSVLALECKLLANWQEEHAGNSILMYIKQDTTLHCTLYLETALHVSGGTSTHHQKRKQLYLQHLVFVTP